jgi:hypothetical protein
MGCIRVCPIYLILGSCQTGVSVNVRCCLNSESCLAQYNELGYLFAQNKLRGLSPQANYTDRATAACRRSSCQLLRTEGVVWSAQRIPTAIFSVAHLFYYFHQLIILFFMQHLVPFCVPELVFHLIPPSNFSLSDVHSGH